jgi:hypothetical protein
MKCVSLDTDKLHRLKGKKFDELYEKHKKKWDEMVASATEYAKSYLKKYWRNCATGRCLVYPSECDRVDFQFEAFYRTKACNKNIGFNGSPSM